METILSQPEEAPTENEANAGEDTIVTQNENQSHHGEKNDGTPKELKNSESTEDRTNSRKSSRTSSSSNDRISKLDELLQNNHQCLALCKAGVTLNDVDVHRTETRNLSGRFNQIEVDQQLSDGQSDSSEEAFSIRYSKNSTYSKASTGSDQVNAIEGHVSVQLPVSLPMPAFCKEAPRCRSQSNQSHDRL